MILSLQQNRYFVNEFDRVKIKRMLVPGMKINPPSFACSWNGFLSKVIMLLEIFLDQKLNILPK